MQIPITKNECSMKANQLLLYLNVCEQVGKQPLTSVLLDYVAEIQREIDNNFVSLPKDKNGKTLHVGDAITFQDGTQGTLEYLDLDTKGWMLESDQAPHTVEKV